MKYNVTKWTNLPPSYNPVTPGKGETGYEAPGKRRVIPAHVIQNMARKAATKPGVLAAKCHFCHDNYEISYMRLCQISMFLRDWACGMCRKQNGITRTQYR